MRSLLQWPWALVISVTLVTGCSYFEKQDAREVESTLSAAGFKMRPADTPEKLTKLQAMPQRKIFTHTKDGEPIYLYADAEFCRCLYAGNEAQNRRYQQLAIEQEIAQERVEAAAMNEDAAMDWGMWGPFW
ncbi:MAG: hypothetical protein AB7V27_04375 [Candidatus Binatia bacterium]